MSDYLLDTQGTLCPIPVIRTQDRIKRLADGDRLEVLCSDPGALHDIPAWCRVHGHAVESSERDEDGVIRIRVLVRRPAG